MDETMAEVLRRKTPAERIGIGFALCSSARRMLLAHLAASYSVWDEPRLRRDVARRMSDGAV